MDTQPAAADAAHDPRFDALARALTAQFGGRAVITPGEALSAVLGGQTLDPEYAARRRLTRGDFPFPTFLVGHRRRVLVADVAATLCRLSPITTPAAPEPEPEPSRRRIGRPRKLASTGVSP